MNNNWVQDDFYALLGINQLASNDDITRAYRLKAKQTHPDVYPSGSIEHKKAEENFKKLSIAKDTLLDPIKRKEHDNQLLLNQQLYISYMANTYSTIPLRKDTPVQTKVKEDQEEEEKPSFKDLLKNKINNGTSKKYVYSEKYNAYVSPEQLKKDKEEEENDNYQEEDNIFDDVMTPQEKSDMYKKEKAQHLYQLAVKALGYGDKYRAQVYFKSARFLDPTIKMPLGMYYK